MSNGWPFKKDQEAWVVLAGKGDRGLGHPGPGIDMNSCSTYQEANNLAKSLVDRGAYEVVYIAHVNVKVIRSAPPSETVALLPREVCA